MSEAPLSAWIVAQAATLGFDLCGVVSARSFPELAHTQEWLAQGYAGEMDYLSDPRRRDPASAMPGVRSVIVCALNYNTAYPRSIHASRGLAQDAAGASAEDAPRGWISRYAWGTDYHVVLKEKLEALLAELRRHCSASFVGRTYADTGPFHERLLAKYAGLGWVGKNTLLLNQKIGSFFFLGVILTDLEVEPTLADAEGPPRDLCGSCRRCIDACPTDAFIEPYVMDARRCISYLTIELRGSIPEEFRAAMGNHVFGCDICQDVCPWNNRAPITQAEHFQPRTFPIFEETLPKSPASTPAQSLYFPELEWLAGLSEAEFREIFRGSPVKRTKWRGLVRNACIALGNASLSRETPAHGRVVELLQRLTISPESHIAESAQWALSRIKALEPLESAERCQREAR